VLGVEVYDENIGLLSKVTLMLGRERYSVRPIGRPEESGLRTFGKPWMPSGTLRSKPAATTRRSLSR
jgi:hypothetical protein